MIKVMPTIMANMQIMGTTVADGITTLKEQITLLKIYLPLHFTTLAMQMFTA